MHRSAINFFFFFSKQDFWNLGSWHSLDVIHEMRPPRVLTSWTSRRFIFTLHFIAYLFYILFHIYFSDGKRLHPFFTVKWRRATGISRAHILYFLGGLISLYICVWFIAWNRYVVLDRASTKIHTKGNINFLLTVICLIAGLAAL